MKNEIRDFGRQKVECDSKFDHSDEVQCRKSKIISTILIKAFEKKRALLREIILLKSAFSVIDQMFHKEIKDAEYKRARMFFGAQRSATGSNPEEMNPFIRSLMDPFGEHGVVPIDPYYEDYYMLYGIDSNFISPIKRSSSRVRKNRGFKNNRDIKESNNDDGNDFIL